ncbi:hypothetical protein GmHk_19G054358 [Glycine max]|nr:hypothetical protein GmHk_19G054358 [Glycine max]
MGPKSTLRLMRILGPSLAFLAQSSWSLLSNALGGVVSTIKSRWIVEASSIGACRPRIFFINGFLCFLEDEWKQNGERKRERRCHFKEKMSLEEAHHHRRPWIRVWRKKEMNEGKGREEHKILCSK